MPRISRLKRITSASLALPADERWERPRAASERISGVHPGRLAHGPEEKCGRTGRTAGLFISRPFQNDALRWGSVARRLHRMRRAGLSMEGKGRTRSRPAVHSFLLLGNF